MKRTLEASPRPGHIAVTRRQFLLGLAAGVPGMALAMPPVDHAVDADSAFLNVSRVIVGDETLSGGVARRIMGLLAARIGDFASQLELLVKSFKATGGSREDMLRGVTDSQVKFALAIAAPWYLGHVGTPSDFVLKDDAVFATYLEAQSWSKIVDEVPRPTYPGADAGSWDLAPPGVTPPAMPDGITQWTFHPGGPAQILAPDSKWRAYATAAHESIDAARAAKPGTT